MKFKEKKKSLCDLWLFCLAIRNKVALNMGNVFHFLFFVF